MSIISILYPAFQGKTQHEGKDGKELKGQKRPIAAYAIKNGMYDI